MQYRTMPGSGEKLSILGYGCMRFPTYFGGVSSNMIIRNKAEEQLKFAIDNGVNYLDSGYLYHLGASESFLGESILNDSEYRKKVFIATKLPCMIVNDKKSIEEYFNKQLMRLQVDKIDYYLLHGIDGVAWDKMKDFGIIDFMNRIRKENKINHMGFSFHGKRKDFMRITDEYDFEFAQVQFNILDEHFQAGIEGIEYANKKGMGIIVMSPLKGGSLAIKIPDKIKKIYNSAKIKKSPAEWGLSWIWNNPAITVVLSGMNDIEHIKENISIADKSKPMGMTEDEKVIITSARDTYNKLLQVRCTGCAYCMPCPAQIDIPAAFQNLNDYHTSSKTQATLFHAAYHGMQTKDGKPHWTSSCINCGKCEKKCPQNIEIRKVFKQVQKDLEKPFIKLVSNVVRSITKRRKKFAK